MPSKKASPKKKSAHLCDGCKNYFLMKMDSGDRPVQRCTVTGEVPQVNVIECSHFE